MGYCPECDALFSSRCWAIHHRAIGVKTHKARAIASPAIVDSASSSSSGIRDRSVSHSVMSSTSTVPVLPIAMAPQQSSASKSPRPNSLAPPAQASVSPGSSPDVSPRSDSDDMSAPTTPHTPTGSSSSSKSKLSRSKSERAERKAEKAAQKEADKAIKLAEKEKRRAERKERKERKEAKANAKTNLAASSPTSPADVPANDTTNDQSSPASTSSTQTPLFASQPAAGPPPVPPKPRKTSAPSRVAPPAAPNGRSPFNTLTPTNMRDSRTTTPASGPPDLPLPTPTTLSPSSGAPSSASPSIEFPTLTPSQSAVLVTSRNAPNAAEHHTSPQVTSPQPAPPVTASAVPPISIAASNSPRPPMSRGQSALLNQIGQNRNKNSVLEPNLVLPSSRLAERAIDRNFPFYTLVQLESDVKPLTEQSTAMDYPIVVQEEVSRLLNDFVPDAVQSREKSNTIDLAFEKLSGTALSIVGMHGNKSEMLAFLRPRCPSLNEDLESLFGQKPGLYAIVGQSLPDETILKGAAPVPDKKLKTKASKRSNAKVATVPVSGARPRRGALILYIILWHTSDAYLNTFTANNKTMHLFSIMHAICAYRLAFFSEIEARHLIRMDNELITSRQDITNIRVLPESMKDPTIFLRIEGKVMFGKTTSIKVHKDIMKALLSVGTFGDEKALYEAGGVHLPDIEYLGGSHSIAFRATPQSASRSSSTNLFNSSSMAASRGLPSGSSVSITKDSTMELAIDSVQNLLAQWGANGTLDLSELSYEDFDALLTDGDSPDWAKTKKFISDETERIESSNAVPKYNTIEQLVDSVIRARLRSNEQAKAIDKFFEQIAGSMPLESREQMFGCTIPVSHGLSKNEEESAKADAQLLTTYSASLSLDTLHPEMPCLVALSRFSLAKCALKLVRVLKTKTPTEQASFILNTLESSEEDVNSLLENLRQYPEFERAHATLFSSSSDLGTESDERLQWYFITLYDNSVVQTRAHILQALSSAGTTLEKLQGNRGGEQPKGEEAEKIRQKAVEDYRADLNRRLQTIYDFQVSNNSSTGQATGHLVRHVVTAYKRDSSGNSAKLSLRTSTATSKNNVVRQSSTHMASNAAGTATNVPRQAEEEMTESTIINFSSADWMATLSPKVLENMRMIDQTNAPSARIFPSASKPFFTPKASEFAASTTTSSLHQSLVSQSDTDCVTYVFYCSSLNVVITAVTRRTKKETQIFGAGGALVGTLPIFCTHVAYSEDSQLIALCGDYVQLFRLLDGCRALSTVPFVSFYVDPRTMGKLQQVIVSGDECYFHTTYKKENSSPPKKPALPPRLDLVGSMPAQPPPKTHNGSHTPEPTVCFVFKVTSAGVCMRLSPPEGNELISSLVVFPNSPHLLLVRVLGGGKGLEGELWETGGSLIDVYKNIPLSSLVDDGRGASRSGAKTAEDSLVHSLKLVTLNGNLFLVNCMRPQLDAPGGTLEVTLNMMRVRVIPSVGKPSEEDIASAKATEMRFSLPCENYLSYFSEHVLKYSPCAAVVTHYTPPTQMLTGTASKKLRVLVGTKDVRIAAEFENYVERSRTLLRYAMISSCKLDLPRVTKFEANFPMPKDMANLAGLGNSSASQPPLPGSNTAEPVVPYFHHTLIRVRMTHMFCSAMEVNYISTAQNPSPLATKTPNPSLDELEEVPMLSLVSLTRNLLCSVPVPVVSSTPGGKLVACLSGGATTLPHAEVVAISNGAPHTRDPTRKGFSAPDTIETKLSFGLIEALIRSWPQPVKIISSFGACGTGKSSLLNHMFGTLFETTLPHQSPFFISSGQVDVKPPRAGFSNPAGAFMSLAPTPTALFIVLDFESILNNKTFGEQSLLAAFNFMVSNLTLWRSGTPIVGEHYEILRTFAMEKERLQSLARNSEQRDVQAWPKSYNSLVVVSDTQRLGNLVEAAKVHFDVSKMSIKHFESNPGPHRTPVLQSMVENRFATVAVPIAMKNLGPNSDPSQLLAVNSKNWKLGSMDTNYANQDATFYASLSNHLARFLDPIISFDDGEEALSHIKKHLSYILWSQTTSRAQIPRLEDAVRELDSLSFSALIYGQTVRNITQKPSQKSDKRGKGSMMESVVTDGPNTFSIGPLSDLSDPDRVVGCPTLDFNLLGIPEPLTRDFDLLQQYFPEEGLVLPIGREALPFNPIARTDWSYYSYVDAILMWNRHVCNREMTTSDVEWTTSLQLFLNALITRRALRVDFWIQIHTADIPTSSSLHKKVVVLREKLSCWFSRVMTGWTLCGQSCANCYYTCTLQAGHPGAHDCLVPQGHKCTAACPQCQTPCPTAAGHMKRNIFHSCPRGCFDQPIRR